MVVEFVGVITSVICRAPWIQLGVGNRVESVKLLPGTITEVFDKALVCEFTVLSQSGRPITHPLIPLYDPDTGKLYVTSSVLFSKKLDHIRKNPKVAALFSNKAALRVSPYRIVLVKGDAKVIEEDIHHGWERLLPLWRKKEPYIDSYVKMRYALPLFWERSVIEVSPVKVYYWPDGNPSTTPQVHEMS
jgi:nitroimidazol reductase NimA-like FMN-containing flavoprotein (pyridoxamine 5'-phosphate oxidase superfamily)